MTTYNRISRFNHWTVAILFLAMLGVGLILEYIELAQPDYIRLITLHKATGVLLLVWAVWRVGYRLKQGFAAPVAPIPAWQERASVAIHRILLLCIILMPLSGLIMAVFSGRPTDVFGLFTIPAIDKVDAIAGTARAVHKWVAYGFIAALALRIGAALKHHLIDKDDTLRRMMTGKVSSSRR